MDHELSEMPETEALPFVLPPGIASAPFEEYPEMRTDEAKGGRARVKVATFTATFRVKRR